ncbi:MAG: malonate decarboxylase subunit epsilon [Candidatus Obscuribacterales bacterium]|nr:malonate decarboxylase subunit epsilon [Candidatus Obscuribacterales bacterium]
MLHSLPVHENVSATIQEASDILGRDVLELDSTSALESTTSVQLSLLIAGVAVASALEAEAVRPFAVGGLSVGAFAAAVVCKALSFEDALLLVEKRGQLMQAACPVDYGMSAIVGLTERKVAELVAICNSERNPLYLSNVNGLLQITVSGSNQALAKVEAAALQSGARRAERLNVSAPSHCALFESCAKALQEEINNIKIEKPLIPYVSNIRARSLRSADALAQDLANNIAHGVRWHDSIAVLVELGTDLFIEMNPGDILSRLGQGSFPEKRFIAAEDASLSYFKQFS